MRTNIFTRRSFTVTERKKIHKRWGGICYLCGKPVAYRDMHADHVVPLSRGGPNTISNLAPTHAQCNLRKGAKL